MRIVPEKLQMVSVGREFGLLTVIGVPFYARVWKHKNRSTSRQFAVCECRCGVISIVSASFLVSGHTGSCGCLIRKNSSAALRRHGGSKTRLHGIWKNMRQRCKNPSCPAYPNYGGRGISICYEWDDFHVFREWALSNGYTENLELDRINNDGNYEPGNVRWATSSDNCNNRRCCNFLTAFGETKTHTQWVRDQRCSITRETINYRLERGWNNEFAITVPARGLC